MLKRKKNIILRPYVVCFFDLLNQRDKLEKAKWFPLDEARRSEFLGQWKEIINTLHAFRAIFEGTLEVEDEVLSTEKNQKLKNLSKSRMKTQMFSDSVILYTEVSADSPASGVIAITNLLLACASVFRTSISRKLVFRGGIEFGLAAEIFENDNGIYGPALYHAYELENSIAGYPRIVVGQHIKGWLDHCIAEAGKYPEEKLIKSDAQFCLELLSVDQDGVMILDYGSNKFPTPSDDFTLRPALDFALEEWSRFKSLGNQKLALRYYMLTRYLAEKMNSE